MADRQLHTLAEWKTLSPIQQGYVLYMEAAWPGSELADVTCPYPNPSKEHREFMKGELKGVLVAQDSEE